GGTNMQRVQSFALKKLRISGPGVLAFVLASLLTMAGQGPALAPTTIVGPLSGTVTDTNKAAIGGATVTGTDQGTGAVRTVTTDADGFYVVTNLPVGTYRVSAQQKGFGAETKSGFRLDADGRITVDLSLKPGAVTETVDIRASSGEALNTVSGEIARVVDSEQVQDIALNGSNYNQLE